MVKLQTILLPILIISCRASSPPSAGMPEEKFVDLYVNSLIITEEDRLTHRDSTHMNARIDSLFESRTISREDFNQRVSQYKATLATWKQFQEKVMRRLEEIQRSELGRSSS